MTVLKLDVSISAPPLAVYDYVTRPALWHEWHPASLGAQDHARQSLRQGERFEEDIRSAGFKRHLTWQVLDSRAAERWEASAAMDDGSTVHLLYQFATDGSGTRFTRTLNYEVKPPVLRLLNQWLFWRKVRAESRRALGNLQQHFEKTNG